MRRVLLLVAAAAALAASAATANDSFPETIPLPNGWMPEGIAIEGTTFYAGSRANGAVYRGDLRTGEGSILVPGVEGRVATGLKFNNGLLFVSGASTGRAWVYDADTGDQLREYVFATPTLTSPTFINDVVVTDAGAFFTDSNRAVIYKVPLALDGTPATTFETIPLTGEYQHVPGFNLNGIDATPDGTTLIAVQSSTGKLFTIDPETGVTNEIDLGGATVINGDGILLHDGLLYVVRNRNNEIAVVELSPDLSSGTIARTITDPDFDVPTTVARLGSRLYLPNARFTTPPTPTTPYNIVQVRR
jgi:outer membrane protein assembly factor BamB